MAGVTESFGIGYEDFWVLKLASDSTVLWQKTYGGDGYDNANSIQQTSDGGYIVAGYTNSFDTLGGLWVLKLAVNGDVQWQKIYGGDGHVEANSIQHTSDGGYIVAGSIYSLSGGGVWDFCVLKLEANGGVVWQKTYGGASWDTANSIRQTGDGGYIVAGETWSFGAGVYDFWVLKLDAGGDVQWQKTYGGASLDTANSIRQTGDGGYIVAGETWSFGAGGRNHWVLKLAANGDIQWQKIYGAYGVSGVNSIQQTGDGGYIVAGTYSVLKLNANGGIVWQKTYGQFGDSVFSIQQTHDMGYIMAGGTNSLSGGGGWDLLVIKVGQDGSIDLSCNFIGDASVSGVDTHANVNNTTVSPRNSNATPQNSNATVQNTNSLANILCMGGEDCTNGIDDDGLVDCADPECCDDPICFDTQICDVITEDLLFNEEATLNNVNMEVILPDPDDEFTCTFNFANLELVRIDSGAFKDKGFFKGTCQITCEGVQYTGEWRGVIFRKPPESQDRNFYLRGAITGGIEATVEGFLTESVPGSENYDKYQATWQVGKLGGVVASFTLNLNGDLSYQSYGTESGTDLLLVRDNIETTLCGYDPNEPNKCIPLNIVLTHLRVVGTDTAYLGEGFSIISYNSQSGSGQGWTYDRLLSPGIVRMEGLFSSPLYGVATATLNETELPRTLSLSIERVDKGKPPAPDLKVKVWGPHNVSPGQTVDYMVEYRNDGTKAAEDVDVNMKLPLAVGYVSNTGEASYNRESHEVVWYLGNVSPKSKGLVSTKETISWGLLGHTFIEHVVFIPIEKEEVYVDPSVNVNPNTIEETENYAKIIGTIFNSSVSENFYLEIFITEVPEEIEPVLNIVETQDGEEYHWKFTGKGHSTDYVDITLKTTKEGRKIVDTFKEGADAMEAKKEHQAFLDALLNEGLISKATHEEYTKWNDFRPVIPLFRYLMGKLPKVGWIEGLFPKGTPLGSMVANSFLLEEIRRNYLIKVSTGSPVFGITGGYLPNVNTITLNGLYELFKRKGSHGTSLGKSEVLTAGDPNIKYGPAGAVVAGQTLDYKIEFENEGEGIAYGVYFTDTLDEDLDESTLVIGKVYDVDTDEEIGPVGTYDSETRTITWFVGGEGEIGPNVGGYAEISVNVKSDAANGTEIINYGTVYFPSVPEETRTNAIVSRIPLIEDCSDEIDNDEDGLIDCEDPDCFGQDCTEVCDDEMDNDGDSFVDCADEDCPPCDEICDDGMDNDRDTLVDCDDWEDCSCCDDYTDYSKGISSISLKGGNKDKATLRMCVNQDFCDALKVGIEEITLKLDDCNEITIPGNKLKADRRKTKFRARPSTYTLIIDCKKGALSLRLKKVALKDCVSNLVKTCVSIKDGPCLCAEEQFTEQRDRKGNLKKLLLKVVGACSP